MVISVGCEGGLSGVRLTGGPRQSVRIEGGRQLVGFHDVEYEIAGTYRVAQNVSTIDPLVLGRIRQERGFLGCQVGEVQASSCIDFANSSTNDSFEDFS